MTDVEFVVAAYAVIIGGLGLYAITLGRRIRDVRDAGAADEQGQLPPPSEEPEAR